MATTKANNSEYQKSLAQYQAVAKYASEVFNQYVVRHPDYCMPMSASEVGKHLDKCRMFFDDTIKGAKEKHCISMDGMQVSTLPRNVFDLCVQYEKMLKIKKADRVVLMHEYTPEKDEILLGVCTIPENIEELTVCCADDVNLRPQMCGVYFDFKTEWKGRTGWAAASDGHILKYVPMAYSMQVSIDGAILNKDFVKRHAGQEISIWGFKYEVKDKDPIYEPKYAYYMKERSEVIEGRYPRWTSVLPMLVEPQYVQIGAAWKQLRETVVAMKDVDFGNMVVIRGSKGESMLTVSATNVEIDQTTMRTVELEKPLLFDFAIGFNATIFGLINDSQVLGLEDQTRAASFYDDKGMSGIIMPMKLTDSTDDTEYQSWSTEPLAEEWRKAHSDTSETESMPEPKVEDVQPEPKVEDAQPESSEPAPAPAHEDEPTAEAPAHEDEPTAEEPAPEPVCEQEKGKEALIDGKWEKVEVLTVSGTRALVCRENKQRKIVKLSDIRDLSATSEPTPAPESAPIDADTQATVEAVAEEIGTKYADERVYIAKYSEKSFILTGNTKQWHMELKKYGMWHRGKQGWILSNKRREYVEQLIGTKLVAA